MKTILSTGIAFLALSTASNAYTISFLNIASADATAVPILDNTGTPIAQGSGFVAVGTFAVVPTDNAGVQAFNVFGSGATAFANGINADGFFDNSSSDAIPAGTVSAPVGQSVYLVIGDGSSLATSSNFAVFDPGMVFGTENAVGAGGLDLNLSNVTVTEDSLVLGTLLTDVDTGLGVTFEKGIALGIPEPSTSLLAGLAGLALAVRRRR